MLGALLAPLTKLFKIKLALDLFLVFNRVIVDPLAALTLQAYKMFLGHNNVFIR